MVNAPSVPVAAGDLLAGRDTAHAPRIIPAPPPGPAHVAHHAPLHFRAIDGSARVILRPSAQAHFLVELRRHFRRVERHLELRAFVFLDVEPGYSVRRALRINAAPPRNAITRRGEAPGKASVVIRPVPGFGDLLAVRVREHHLDLAAGERFVAVLCLVGSDYNPFVLHGLARPIERAVGEKNRLIARIGIVWFVTPEVLRRSNFPPVVPGADERTATVLRIDREKTELVRFC